MGQQARRGNHGLPVAHRIEADDVRLAVAEPLEGRLEVHRLGACADHEHPRREALRAGEDAEPEEDGSGEREDGRVEQHVLQIPASGHEEERPVGDPRPDRERPEGAPEKAPDRRLAVAAVEACGTVGRHDERRKHERRRKNDVGETAAVSLQADGQHHRRDEPTRLDQQLNHRRRGEVLPQDRHTRPSRWNPSSSDVPCWVLSLFFDLMTLVRLGAAPPLGESRARPGCTRPLARFFPSTSKPAAPRRGCSVRGASDSVSSDAPAFLFHLLRGDGATRRARRM